MGIGRYHRAMIRSQRRLLLFLAVIPALAIVTAWVYMAGMSHFEGESRNFWQAIAWSAETLTTTGYGADSAWSSPWMILFVVIVQFLGVFLVFLVFPVYLIPFLEERFQARLPRSERKMDGHVVVFGYGAAVATLLPQLEAAGLKTLVIERREEEARRLLDREQRVLYGRLEDGVLEEASLLAATALIANSQDAENAAVILAARQMGFEGSILALVEDPWHRRPMSLAGADAVFTPRHMLGAALAARASARVSPRLVGVQQLGEILEVREIRVAPSSDLANSTLAESGVGALTGATVIAQWVGGSLEAELTATMRLHPNGILVAAGSSESLEKLEELARGHAEPRRRGPFVVGGFGEVGRKVVELLRDAGEEVLVIDREPREGVDQIGDVLDPQLLERLEIGDSQAVILALDNDSSTLLATVILKGGAPSVPVIARVNEAENVERIRRAGAEFALSMSQVSGQILAHRLLGEEAVAVHPQLKVSRMPAPGLAGKGAVDLNIRQRTGCSVVAVERGDQTLVELSGDFVFEKDDVLFVSGPAKAVGQFAEAVKQFAAASGG